MRGAPVPRPAPGPLRLGLSHPSTWGARSDLPGRKQDPGESQGWEGGLSSPTRSGRGRERTVHRWPRICLLGGRPVGARPGGCGGGGWESRALGRQPPWACVRRPPGRSATRSRRCPAPVNKAACESFMGLRLKIDEVRPLGPTPGARRRAGAAGSPGRPGGPRAGRGARGREHEAGALSGRHPLGVRPSRRVTGWEEGPKGRGPGRPCQPSHLTVASPLVSVGPQGGPGPAPHCQTAAQGLDLPEETPRARRRGGKAS